MSKSTTNVDECSEEFEAYSNVDEIGMDGFCLMTGSTRQENACEEASSLSKECGDALVSSMRKFLKRDKPTTTSQDDDCLVAIKENAGMITCLPSCGVERLQPEGISFSLGGGKAGSSSSKSYCASDSSRSTKKSQVYSPPSCKDVRRRLRDEFDNIHDAFDFLVKAFVRNDPLLAQRKKEKKKWKSELALVKNELNKWTNLSQANNGVVECFDVLSSKSLDSIDRSKNDCA